MKEAVSVGVNPWAARVRDKSLSISRVLSQVGDWKFTFPVSRPSFRSLRNCAHSARKSESLIKSLRRIEPAISLFQSARIASSFLATRAAIPVLFLLLFIRIVFITFSFFREKSHGVHDQRYGQGHRERCI